MLAGEAMARNSAVHGIYSQAYRAHLRRQTDVELREHSLDAEKREQTRDEAQRTGHAQKPIGREP